MKTKLSSNCEEVPFSGKTHKTINGYQCEDTGSGSASKGVAGLDLGHGTTSWGTAEKTYKNGFLRIEKIPGIDSVIVGSKGSMRMLIANRDNPQVLTKFEKYYVYDNEHLWVKCTQTNRKDDIETKYNSNAGLLIHIPTLDTFDTPEPPDTKPSGIFETNGKTIKSTQSGFEKFDLDKDEDDIETSTTELWSSEVEMTLPETDHRETPKSNKEQLLDLIIDTTEITNREAAKVFLNDEIDEVMSDVPNKDFRTVYGEGRHNPPKTDLRKHMEKDLSKDELQQIKNQL